MFHSAADCIIKASVRTEDMAPEDMAPEVMEEIMDIKMGTKTRTVVDMDTEEASVASVASVALAVIQEASIVKWKTVQHCHPSKIFFHSSVSLFDSNLIFSYFSKSNLIYFYVKMIFYKKKIYEKTAEF